MLHRSISELALTDAAMQGGLGADGANGRRVPLDAVKARKIKDLASIVKVSSRPPIPEPRFIMRNQ